MAHHKSAKKRIRQNAARRTRNKAASSEVRTVVKKVYATKDKADAEKFLKEAVSILDKNVSKKRLPKNTAARRKSKLTKYVNGLK